MTELITAMIATVCLVASLVLRFEPFTSVITRKENVGLVAGYSVVCMLNVMGLYLSFRSQGISMDLMKHNILVFGIVTEIINMIVIPKRTREHMFVFGIVVTCNAILTAIPLYVVKLLSVTDIGTRRMVSTMLFVVLLVGTYYPIRLLLKKTVEPFLFLDDDDGYWKTVWFIPVGMCFAMYFAFPGEIEQVTGMSIISRLLTGASIISLSIGVARNYERIRNKQQAQNALNDQKILYAGMKQRVEEVRKARHDFKHYMAAIQRFVETEDKEGLQKYCYELENQYNQEGAVPYTGNAAVDGVLFRYTQLCKERGVAFRYVGRIMNEGIGDLDICVLLGNALDNGLEATVTSKHPEIKVVAQSEKHMLSIMVRNTFDGVLKVENNELLSRKRQRGKGIGLASMQAICDKYGGTMETKWDEKTFTILFILPIKCNSRN